MIPKSSDAARSDSPRPSMLSLMNGTIIISPKNPNTTEGMPARSSTPDRSAEAMGPSANRERKMAVRRPPGTPTRIAPAVT